MAIEDLYTNFQLLFRWLHVLAGIFWIGHLYFFNFVNAPMQAVLDDPTKKAVNPKLMPRALWWFRWGAMITFVMGLVLFTQIYMFTPGQGFGPSSAFSIDGHLTGRAVWILLGMLFGTIMWFNVWFVIWPTQKNILGGKLTAEQLPDARKRAALFSKINTYLSGPMLFCMLAPGHYGSINPITAIVCIALGVAAIAHAYKFAPKVGTSV